MGELWETLGKNASDLEIKWSAAFCIIFLLAAWRLIKFGVLFLQMIHRNGQYVQERHVDLIWIVRYLERSYLAGVFAFVGAISMLAPEPIRTATQEASVVAGWLFLSAAFAMLIGSIVEEWLEWHFPPGTRKSKE